MVTRHRGRMKIAPEVLFAALGLPGDTTLVGPCDGDGCLELTVEHPKLPALEIPEAAQAPLITRHEFEP